MTKYIILSLLFPLIASASFDRDLFYGLRQDPQVTELQEFLTTQGVYSGPVTGNFFSLTLKAVKDFQPANLISSTGYFGPLTRAKTNSLLSAVTDESGTSISPTITPPKTTDDLVAKLMEQIILLQQQLAELQKQQAVLVEQNQKLGAIQTQVTEQQQTLTQIQTNTAPPPPTPLPPPPPPPPEVKKEIKVSSCSSVLVGKGCGDIEVFYFEEGQRTNASSVSILSNDSGGRFIESSYPGNKCIGAEAANSDGTQRKGNPLTCPTRPSGKDGKPTVYFSYYPSFGITATTTTIITATVNGTTATSTILVIPSQ